MDTSSDTKILTHFFFYHYTAANSVIIVWGPNSSYNNISPVNAISSKHVLAYSVLSRSHRCIAELEYDGRVMSGAADACVSQPTSTVVARHAMTLLFKVGHVLPYQPFLPPSICTCLHSTPDKHCSLLSFLSECGMSLLPPHRW